jgi:hypothetical protein
VTFLLPRYLKGKPIGIIQSTPFCDGIIKIVFYE